MAFENTEKKYIKWHIFLTLAAISISAYVSINVVKKQNDNWKYQYSIQTRQRYNDIRVKKIEDTIEAFHQFILMYEKKADIQYSLNRIMADSLMKGIFEKDKDLFNSIIVRGFDKLLEDQESIVDLRTRLIFHLKTLKSLFSDEIVNDSNEIIKMVKNYEIDILSPDGIRDFKARAKAREKIGIMQMQIDVEKFIEENRPKIKENEPLIIKFNSLVEKMYSQVKYEMIN